MTMPTSRSGSPSRLLPLRPRKKVNWNLSEEGTSGESSVGPDLDPLGVEEGANGREEQIEELRRQLTRDLPQNRPPNPRSAVSRPKPVLRRGDQTPPSGLVSPLSEPYEFISNRDTKTRSAEDAQERALQVQRSVTDESDTARSWQQDRRRGHSPRRLSSLVKDLYYYPESLKSGQTTPMEPNPLALGEECVSRPKRYRISGLSAQTLLQRFSKRGIHTGMGIGSRNSSRSPSPSPYSSRNSSLMNLVGASSNLGSLAAHDAAEQASAIPSADYSQSKRPGLGRRKSTAESILESISQISRKRGRQDDVETLIKKHTEDTEERQRYLLKLCKAFLVFGVPTHRIESLLDNTAKDLDIDAQFFYLPGCMLVSFGDRKSRTGEVKLVKAVQGLDLGKMGDAYFVYKNLFHDDITTREAIEELDGIIRRPRKYKTWFLIAMYGLASLSVGPFAFQAQWLDLPVAFVLGCIMGSLKVVWSARSTLYANVFEFVSVMVTSFLSRWMGSIAHHSVFCFSSLAQSSIALILPGFVVVIGTLELQSRSLIAGTARVMYAIIYSMTLGFGITAGVSFYGLIDRDASSDPFCSKPIAKVYYPLFVPLFTFALMAINNAKWGQMPVMLLVSCLGYGASFGISQALPASSTISAAGAALVIGFLANLYGRIGYQVNTALHHVSNWIGRKLGRRRLPTMTQQSPQLYMSDNSTPSSGSENHEKRNSIQYKPSFLQRARRSVEKSTRYKYGRGSEDLEAGFGDESREVRRRTTRRMAYNLAAATMIPALLVQVPSGISATGSLVAGIQAANDFFGNKTLEESSVNNPGLYYQGNPSYEVGYSIIQISIGITAGLFIGTVLVYPLGRDSDRARSSKNRLRGAVFSF